MRAIAAFLISLWLLSPVHAEEPDGKVLFRMCNSEQNVVACLFYVSGFRDGLAMGMAADWRNELCLPGKLSGMQMVLIVQKFMRENPSRRHLPGEILVLEALLGAFPCKTQ